MTTDLVYHGLPAQPSAVVWGGFVGIALVLVALWTWANGRASRELGEPPEAQRRWRVRAALVGGGWLGITGALGASGWLAMWGAMPPRIMLVFAVMLGLGLWIGLGAWGKRLALGLSTAGLVGAQAFRLPLELLMHQAAAEGVMPPQMSYSGRNFDILTGIAAAALWVWSRRAPLPRSVVLAWNVVGLALLVNVVGWAVVSMPTPLRVLFNDPPNVWIAHTPFVWLPTVMVLGAMIGHIVSLRRLRLKPGVEMG